MAGRWIPVFAALAGVMCGPWASAAAPDFVRDVRPILERSCFGCHGPQKQKGGYRLDRREDALRGGDSGQAAIVPHAAAKSPLIRYVSGQVEDMLMPPEESGKARLSGEEIALLRAWIDAGPSWPEVAAGAAKLQWSLLPLKSPPIPGTEANPIDSFIRAKLKEKHLTPSPEADRRTLIRRVYYDLIGLPPRPEDVAAFVADADPRAYEKLVERLLASPRYGEHWARHWLDVANYADTHGNDHDYARFNAWPYRDYVIRSFNEDKPYGRFVREQVAGDALYPDDPQATVALGFLAAGPWDDTLIATVRDDTVDHAMGRNLDRDGYVTTVMSTFQSLTVHCARCHDHKFDPVTQKEYYGLQAVFAGIDRADRPFDTDVETHKRRRELLARQRALRNPDAALLASLDSPEVRQAVVAWEARAVKQEQSWKTLEVQSVLATGGATFAKQPDGSWFVGGTRPERDTYIVTARWPSGRLAALRLETLPDERLPQKGPGRFDNGHFHLTEFRAFAARPGDGKGAAPIPFSRAAADVSEGPNTAAQAIDGKNETHWGIHPRYGERHVLVAEVKSAEELPEGATLTLFLEFQGKAPGHGIGRFRLSATGEGDAAESVSPVPEVLKVAPDQRTAAQRRALALIVLTSQNERAIAALPQPGMVYAATHDFPARENFKPSAKPRPIHRLIRGDITRPAEPIGPSALACVPGMPGELSIPDANEESTRRTALANWLADDRNVLTWRSIVNRVWHYHFGRGICDSPNDFGAMGGTPSHPELLDWLAIWFRDDAHGSLKQLHRLIVTSATYKQSSLSTQDSALRTDSDNRFLWRMNRPRLTAEQTRDSVLQLSNQLNLSMGGPSVVQFIHKNNATFMTSDPAFLDYDNFNPDAPEQRRRAIYRFVFRTVPDPFMDALDAPDGGAATPARGVSTTPVQAFAMLNDAFLIRQSQHIAARISADAKTPEILVDSAFQLILLRPPKPAERTAVAAYVKKHGLGSACHLLLNSNEFLYID